MGLISIHCPECGKAHMWFTGDSDQCCPQCLSMHKCGHKSLRFGSGGFYIFCNNCDRVWTATIQGKLHGNAALDGMQNSDIRVKK